MDSDRPCLVIRDYVFFLFYLQGTVDGFARSSGPLVCVAEWKPVLSMRRVCEGNIYVNAGYFHDSFSEISFKLPPSCHCHGWVLQLLVQRGLPHYQICFLLSLLWEVPKWHGVLELSDAHVNSLSKELHLRHRETLCILLIELYLYSWHNCVFVSKIGSLITSQSKVQNQILVHLISGK